MAAGRERWLGVSVASCRIAYVLLIGGQVKEWAKSREATKTVPKARSFIRMAMERHKPDYVVLEDPGGKTRKRGQSLKILQALVQDLKDNSQAHCLRERSHSYANKHEEAIALAKDHPEIGSELPKRHPFYDNEDPKIAYFEALSLVEKEIRAHSKGT